MFLILLILFDGLRWQMGTDWQNYYDYFLKSDQYDQAGMEIGFKLYTSTIRFFTENYSVYLLITTALIYIGIFYPVFRITGYKFMPIFYLTGCIPWYSGSLRQMMASIFFTMALCLIYKRKLLFFLIVMLTGATFHTTILVFIPIYWLYGISTTTFVIVLVSLFLVSTLIGSFLSRIDQLIQLFNPGKSIEERFGGNELKNTNPIFGFLRKIITTVGYIWFWSKSKKQAYIKEEKDRMLFFLYITTLSIFLYFLGSFYLEHVSSRLDIYSGIISAAVLIGLLEKELINQKSKTLLLGFTFVLLLIFYARLEYTSLFHPYSSIFYNYDYKREFY